jgi:UDP-4-amino-4,6-dideoxy-N-acetyl-beta-L-altrosamine N-acetyltransferase
MNKFGLLRNINDSELEMMLSWRNDPAVRNNMYNKHLISLDEHMEWWERTKLNNDNIYFMYEDDGKPLGIVAITDISKSDNNASWAFYSSPESKKGTGSKMEFLALDFVFNELGLHKLWCEVLDFNQAVINMHKKFGFKLEGVLRSHHCTDSGYIDVHRLGILKTEWLELRESMKNKLLRLSGSRG